MNSNPGGHHRDDGYDEIISGRERIARERARYSQRDTYIFPRPRNVRSSEKRLHLGSWLVLLLILAGLGGIAYWIYSYQFGTETTVRLTVNRLDDQAAGNNGHKYLVFTTLANGQPEVFQNTDAFFHGKWNSSDVQAALKPGVRYTCDVYGRRHPVLSQYRDILSCTRITAGALGQPVTAVLTAARPPVIYNYASGWSHAQVKPPWIVIGQGGSPMAHTWHWNAWGPKTATSTGTLWTNNCVPNCALGKPGYHKLYVTLYWVKSHDGQPYFYGMKWYTPGYALNMHGHPASTNYLHFTNGFWR